MAEKSIEQARKFGRTQAQAIEIIAVALRSELGTRVVCEGLAEAEAMRRALYRARAAQPAAIVLSIAKAGKVLTITKAVKLVTSVEEIEG